MKWVGRARRSRGLLAWIRISDGAVRFDAGEGQPV